jgi:hypothetical protein
LIFASEYPRITNRLIRIATLTVAGGPYIALAVGSAASAGATPTPAPTASAGAAPLAAAQAKAKVAITARLAWLNTTIPAVTANMLITAADRATLLATLNSHATELTALGQKISADTRTEHAEADYQPIFTGLPGLRVGADAGALRRCGRRHHLITSGVLPKLTDPANHALGTAGRCRRGEEHPPVQAPMTDPGKQISAITTATNGLSATVLAYTPAQYDANHPLLSQPRAALTRAGACRD